MARATTSPLHERVLPLRLLGSDHLEVLVDEDVVRPVDPDHVDVVFAVAELHHTIDNAPRIGSQRGFRRLVGCRPLTIVPDPWLQFAGIWPTCFDVVAAPRWKGITFAAAAVVVPPPPVDCRITWVAVMVVPLVVPSTRTRSPFVTALAEVELVPFLYFVEDTSSTVTFWPAEVVSVKLDLDTRPTVPDAPPAAGPLRALDPPPPDRGPAPPLGAGVVEEDEAVAEGAVTKPTETPIPEHISAAATIHPLLLVGSSRRTRSGRAGVAMVTGANSCVVEPDSGSPGLAPWGLVGSYSFIRHSFYSRIRVESARPTCEVLLARL
jgi:hypothetical protein